jgi:hypothetical protein
MKLKEKLTRQFDAVKYCTICHAKYQWDGHQYFQTFARSTVCSPSCLRIKHSRAAKTSLKTKHPTDA